MAYREAGIGQALGSGLWKIGELLAAKRIRDELQREKETETQRAGLQKLGITLTVPQSDVLSTIQEPVAAAQELPAEFANLPAPARLQGVPTPPVRPVQLRTPLPGPAGNIELPDLAPTQGPPLQADLREPVRTEIAPPATQYLGPKNVFQEVQEIGKTLPAPGEPGFGVPVPLPSGRGVFDPTASDQAVYARTLAARDAMAARLAEGERNRGASMERTRATIAGRAEQGTLTRAHQIALQEDKQSYDLYEKPLLRTGQETDPATGKPVNTIVDLRTGKSTPVKDVGGQISVARRTWIDYMDENASSDQRKDAADAATMLPALENLHRIQTRNPQVRNAAGSVINVLRDIEALPKITLSDFLGQVARAHGTQVLDSDTQEYMTNLYTWMLGVNHRTFGSALTGQEIARSLSTFVPVTNESEASMQAKWNNMVQMTLAPISVAGAAWQGPSLNELQEEFGVTFTRGSGTPRSAGGLTPPPAGGPTPGRRPLY